VIAVKICQSLLWLWYKGIKTVMMLLSLLTNWATRT